MKHPKRSTDDLPQLLGSLCRDLNAAGVLLLIIDKKNNRCELVAACQEEITNLADMLQRLTDSVKDGNGLPLKDDHTRLLE